MGDGGLGRSMAVVGVVLAMLGGPGVAAGAGDEPVHARFDLSSPHTSPFPSDRFTVADSRHLTGRRVALPVPEECTTIRDECGDLEVLNKLDGFSAQPRLSIPFDGDVDSGSVSSDTVFLVRLGDDGTAQMSRVDRVVWDPPTRTLHAWAAEQLEQHTRYALVVTRGVRDSGGNPVAQAPAFEKFIREDGGRRGDHPYRLALRRAIEAVSQHGIDEDDIAVASVFTTQSVTASLEQIAGQIRAGTPVPADFGLGPVGGRTVFDFAEVQSIVHRRQVGVSPPAFSDAIINLAPTRFVPGAVGQIAFGHFSSPIYLRQPEAYIPSVPTAMGVPRVQAFETVYFTLAVPSGEPPVGGWPVVIYGHGATTNKDSDSGVFQFASVLASHGLATIAINQVGRGFGPASTLSVRTADGGITTFPSGGRGIDQNGDNVIGNREGDEATAPRRLLLNRDSIQQHVADLLQLTRVVQVGVDIDGDGGTDLDAGHISYLGFSLGGMYGLDFFALEPAIDAAVLNVPGAPLVESRRLSPLFRPGLGQLFADREPSLANAPGIAVIGGVTVRCPCFNEKLPLHEEVPSGEPIVNDISGAMPLQQWLDRAGWAAQASNPAAWAGHLRRDPLDGVSPRPLILQFARSDQVSVNPSSYNIVRAGDLADRTTLYRHDLYRADHPTATKNPHGFLSLLANPVNNVLSPIAYGALEQAAVFIASDGNTTIDPDAVTGTSDENYFETPITPDSLVGLQTLGYIA